MGDLVAFLRARLDEDEAAARAAASVAGPGWHSEVAWGEDIPQMVVRGDGDAWLAATGTADDEELGPFIARHDPARVLREVAAKRAILGDYEEAAERPYDLPEGIHDGRDDDEREIDQCQIDVLESILRHLAAVYRDHPDYDPAWGPE